MEYEDFDKRDTCLQISHYVWAKSVLNIMTVEDMMTMGGMVRGECLLSSKLGHRKNHTYRWSNSDGLTKWAYDKVLKYIKINPYKGLNGDQYRAFFILLQEICGDKHVSTYRGNILFGFLVRLGFTPSLMEHCFFKPQTYALLLHSYKYHWFNPIYWVSRVAFHFSMKKNLKEPIKGHSTNKISLIPTMYYLGYELPSKEYTDAVYDRYYKPFPELRVLMKAAINKLREEK